MFNATPDSPTLLILDVGPYRLALRTQHVAAVQTQLHLLDYRIVGDPNIPWFDLQTLFGGPNRSVIPFGITVDLATERFVLGVDAVKPVAFAKSPQMLNVPTLEYPHKELIEGAFEHEQRWVLMLRPYPCRQLCPDHEAVDLTL